MADVPAPVSRIDTVRRLRYLDGCCCAYIAGALALLALAFPGGAAAQEKVLNGDRPRASCLPMTLDGCRCRISTPGLYTFSLLDQSGQHSIHVRGPFDRPGISAETVNFGTAGPDGGNVLFAVVRLRQIFPDIPLEDGLYRWFCDRHSDMMTGSVSRRELPGRRRGDGRRDGDERSRRPRVRGPLRTGTAACKPAGDAQRHAFHRLGLRPLGWADRARVRDPAPLSVSGKIEVKAFFRKLPITASAAAAGESRPDRSPA